VLPQCCLNVARYLRGTCAVLARYLRGTCAVLARYLRDIDGILTRQNERKTRFAKGVKVHIKDIWVMSKQKSNRDSDSEGLKVRVSAPVFDTIKGLMENTEKIGNFLPVMAFKEPDGRIHIVHLKGIYDEAVEKATGMTEDEILKEIKELKRERKRAIWMGDREIEAILSVQIQGLNDAYSKAIGGS